MTEFKKGDVVLFDDKEYSFVSLNEENETECVLVNEEDGEEIVVDIQEVTAAAKTIEAKPSAATSPSKSQMVASVIQKISHMPASDAVDFFNKMMTQVGKEGDATAGKAAGNEASIKAKPSHASSDAQGDRGDLNKHSAIFDDVDIDAELSKTIKEDIADIFGNEELSEDFKEKVTTLFEAAVTMRTSAQVEQIKEDLEAKFEETIAEALTTMEENVDKYLSYVAEQWVEENEVAVEYGVKEQMAESFIAGLKQLFAEHYWEVPEDKVDAYEELAEKVASLEEELNSVMSENVELTDLLAQVNAEEVFKEVSEGLALTQVDKFKTLAESVEFDGDEDKYRQKLETLKDHYFTKKAPQESTLYEEVELDDVKTDDVKKGPDPIVNRYADAIKRTIKR